MVAIEMMQPRKLPPPSMQLPENVARMKEALRRAILTLLAVPDPDKKFLRITGPRWGIVRQAAEAYGWTPEVIAFRPTPRDVQVYLDVLSWLSWYERERQDEESVQLVISWSTGIEWRILQHKFAASERTLRRRLDNLCCVLVYEFTHSFQKLFLDECRECPAKGDSEPDESDLALEDEQAVPSQKTSWIAEGERPSADETVPAVGEARAELTERLTRQNSKREARQRCAAEWREK